MKKMVLISVMVLCFGIGGCAFLDKIAPAQYDEQGQIIPGSRVPISIVSTVADNVPYGNVALTVILALATGYEKFRSYKMEKGLRATLLAGKQVASDPDMKELWDKIKDEYRQAHENAGVTPLIKELLAKLPSTTKSI